MAHNTKTDGVDNKNIDGVTNCEQFEVEEPEVEEPEVDTRFGIGRFKPRAIQRLASIRWFTGFYSLVALMMSTLIVYVNSQITTLERQFGFNSKQTGLIMAANDIGYLICVLFVSHSAKMVHIPRVLAITTIFFGVSGLVCSFPHFFYGSVFLDDVTSDNTTSFPDKEASDLHVNESIFGQLCSFKNRSEVMCENKAGDNHDNTNAAMRQAAISSLAIIVIGMILQGVGKSPRTSFTMVYIDDNTNRVKSGFYIGILVTVSIMGPGLAFVMGGIFSRMYVTLGETDLYPKHPNWIGAWWLGFLVFGGFAVLAALPMFCFPAKMPKKSRKNSTTGKRTSEKQQKPKRSLDKSILRQAKLFLESLFRIFTNTILILMVASTCCSLFMVGGSSAYSPKYLERVFDLPAYKANYIMAGQMILTGCVGTFIGGYLTKYYKMTAKKALYFIVIMSFCSAVFSVLNIFAYCEQPEVHNWPGDSDASLQTCHGDCHCEEEKYFPICGGDGKTYYSPCTAGCLYHNDMDDTYSNCSCIEGGQASSGICPYGCEHVYFFTIVNGLTALFSTMCFIPKITVMIRIVEERDKSLAIGVASFLASLLGSLLGPIIFGIVIDGVCSLWDRKCGFTGRCLLYDNDLFRWRLNGFGCIGLGLAFLFLFLALCYALLTGCLDDIGIDGRGDEVKDDRTTKGRGEIKDGGEENERMIKEVLE